MQTRIKSVIGTIIVLGAIFCTVTYTACKKAPYVYVDNCKDVVCQHNGTCYDGTCDCTAGYTGDHCEKKNIAPYLGNWDVTQKIVSSTNAATIGQTKQYHMVITEDPAGVTILNMGGFLGNPSYFVTARIGMTNGTIIIDSVAVESEVVASPSDFLFKTYQPLGKSKIQLVKGDGSINGLGTVLSGQFHLSYPDSVKGVIEDWISFNASYIN